MAYLNIKLCITYPVYPAEESSAVQCSHVTTKIIMKKEEISHVEFYLARKLRI